MSKQKFHRPDSADAKRTVSYLFDNVGHDNSNMQDKPRKYKTYCGFEAGFLLNQYDMPPSSDYNIIMHEVMPIDNGHFRISEYELCQYEVREKSVKITVEALASYGLTEQYLRKNLSLKCFCVSDANDLIYFVTGKHPSHEDLPVIEYPISPAQAIREINDLCINEHIALSNLYAYGLRGKHLRLFKPAGKESFSHEHGRLLKYLMRDKPLRLNPNDAMSRINGMTSKEVDRILDALSDDIMWQTFRHGCSKNFGKMLGVLEAELSTCGDLQSINLRFRHLDNMASMELTRMWSVLSPFQQLQDVCLDYNEIHRMTDEQFKTLLDCDIFGAILNTLINYNHRATKSFGSKLLSMKDFNIHKLFFRLKSADLLNFATLIIESIDIENESHINLLRDIVIHAQALNVDNGFHIDENLYDFYVLLFAKNKNGEFEYKDIIRNFEFVFGEAISRLEKTESIYFSSELIDNTLVDPSKNPYAMVQYNISANKKLKGAQISKRVSPDYMVPFFMGFAYGSKDNFKIENDHSRSQKPSKYRSCCIMM